MVIAKWGDRSFYVKTNTIYSFSKLMYEFEAETEEVTNGTQRFIKVKAQKPRSTTLKVLLDARLGTDVRKHIDWYLDRVYKGSSAYLYVQGKKLLPCELIITKAAVSSMELAPDGKMIMAEMELTFTQSTRMDGTEYIAPEPVVTNSGGGGGGGGGGSRGGSGSKKPPSKPSGLAVGAALIGAAAGAVAAARSIISNASRASKVIKTLTGKGR